VVSTNIEAGGKARFMLTYEELLERTVGRYEHVIHVNPGQVVKDFKVEVHINESLPLSYVKVPEFKTSPNAITDSSKENQLAVVERNVDNNPRKAKVTFKPSISEQSADGLKGEFIVQYDVDRKNEGNDIQVLDGYFVHFFAPDNLQPLPKHVVFVLDVSGSMRGTKLKQTKDAMIAILDDMTDNDFFNIITFSDDVYHWLPSKASPGQISYRGSPGMVAEALDYVLGLSTIGGTNIHDGMIAAIDKVL